MTKENRKKKITQVVLIIGVIVIPLLYSYFYLGAFWDPYSRLESLPVAVVNNDKGAVINGKNRNLGQELCNELNKNNALKFVVTDEAEAEVGTKGSTYYAQIIIPQDFSADVASAETTNKQTAKLLFSPNEEKNYLASQILGKATLTVEETLRSNVNKEITSQLADKLQEVPGQLGKMQDGLGELQNGSVKLADGTDKLANGTAQLKDGSSQLTAGAGNLKNGTAELANGTAQLKNGSSQLTEGAGNLTNGTSDLADGTAKLKGGSGQLVAGSSALANGTSQFNEKFGQYQDGVSSVANGAQALTAGATKLDSGLDALLAGAGELENGVQGLPKLQAGAQALAQKSSEFSSGVNNYVDGVNQLIGTVQDTSGFLKQYVTAHPELMQDPSFAAFIGGLSSEKAQGSISVLAGSGDALKSGGSALASSISGMADGTGKLTDLQDGVTKLKAGLEDAKKGSSQLVNGADSLSGGASSLNKATSQLASASADIKSGAANLNAGAQTLDTGVASAKAGAEKLYGGSVQLENGIKTLDNGLAGAKSGADKLYDGSAQLENGIVALNSGIVTADKGANDLKDGQHKVTEGLTTAKNGVDSSLTEANQQISSLDGLGEFASAPVNIEQSSINAVPNYGTAFAPYFLSLSMWVGALIIFVGIFLDADEKIKLLSRNSENKLLRTGIYLLLALTQAFVLALVLRKALGLQVNHPALFYFSCALVSMVFLSIVQFLMVFFKDVGKFLTLLLLILQLTSCGGTFPMETVPKIFNVLYPFMPMTYSVNLFREAISGTGDHAGFNIAVLATILVVFTGMTLIFSVIQKKHDNKVQIEVR